MNRLLNTLFNVPDLSRRWHVITIHQDGSTEVELCHSRPQAEWHMEREAKAASHTDNPVREFFVVETGKDRETVPMQFKVSR